MILYHFHIEKRLTPLGRTYVFALIRADTQVGPHKLFHFNAKKVLDRLGFIALPHIILRVNIWLWPFSAGYP
jgi:hypothetical protein